MEVFQKVSGGRALLSERLAHQNLPLTPSTQISRSEWDAEARKMSEDKTDREVTYIKAKLKHQITAARRESASFGEMEESVCGRARKIKTKELRGVKEIK